MRILITVLTLFFVTFANTQIEGQTQHFGCATPEPTKEEIKYTLDVVNQISEMRNGSTTHLPIRFHVIRRNDGSGGISTQELNKAVATLNTYFRPIDVEFFIADINNIDDSNYFALDFDTEIESLSSQYQVNDAVNIFMADRLTKSGYEICGYAYYPSEETKSLRMFMANGCTNDGVSANFPHEFGHFFNLYHTFRGTSNGQDDPHAECVPRTGQYSNCETHGDLICDTEADPRGYVNSSCNYIGSETDLYGHPFTPPVGNIMTYYSKKCGAEFTQGQYNRMHQGLTMRLSYNTYDVDGASYADVNNPSELTAQVGEDYTIQLNWKDNSTNETGFLIERSEDNGKTYTPIMYGGAGVDQTTYHDTDVESNKSYTYRIKASNDNPNDYTNATEVTSDLTYCLPQYQENSCSLLDVGAGMQRVQIGTTLDNVSSCDGSYTVYVQDVAPAQMTTGESTPFSIELMKVGGNHVPQNVTIWADLDQDGEFEGGKEMLFKSDFGFNGPATVTGNITIPACTTEGITTLRIRTLYLPMGIVDDPCRLYHFGEAEDYAIEVIEGEPTFGSITMEETSGSQANDGVICAGAQVQLRAKGGVNYFWDNGSMNPLRTVQSAGTYTVTVLDGSGCEDVESVTITESNSLEGSLTIENDGQTLCEGMEATLLAEGGDFYFWDNGSSLPYRTVTVAGDYAVTISDLGGCQTVETITVNFATADASYLNLVETSGNQNNDGKMCAGDMATLTAEGGIDYIWSDGSTAATRTVTEAGTYTVTITNTQGCSTTESVTLEVNEIADARIFANGETIQGDLELCYGESVVLSTDGEGVTWENGSQELQRTVSASGLYTVSVQNAEGCISETAVNVTVRDQVSAEITVFDSSGDFVNDGIACQGEDVILRVTGGVSYIWDNGATSSGRTVTTSGTYGVVVTDDLGCTAYTSYDIIVSEIETPVIAVIEDSGTRANDGEFCQGEAVELQVITTDNITWENGSTASTRLVNTGGYYTVETTNTHGCKAEASINLTEIATQEVEISVDNLNDPELTFLQYGDEAILTTNAVGDFVWNTGEETEQIITDKEGLYSVVVTDENLCSSEAYTYVAFSLILSLEGLELTVEQNDNAHNIAWTVPSDENIANYAVQRKINDGDFETIHIEESLRSSLDPYYSIEDADISEIGTFYYRIMTTDYTGAEDYSDVVVVEVEMTDEQEVVANDMKVYPNPTQGLFKIDLTKYDDAACSINLTVANEMGRVVYQEVLAGDQYEETSTYTVDLTGATPGVYFVEVQRCAGKSIERLVITD